MKKNISKANQNLNSWKRLCRLKKAVTLFTRHHDGDKYHGVLLACCPDLIILEDDNDFVFDGIVALPTRQLKLLRAGAHEKIIDKIYSRHGLLKKIERPSWLLKVKSIQQLMGECYRRKLWPVIETQSKGTSALFIGPVTNVEKNSFHIFCYDAKGKWEKNYELGYKEVFKVQLFDKYSKYFNQFMKEEVGMKNK